MWLFSFLTRIHFNRLVQERRNSIANALEVCLSCTNPSIWSDCLQSCHYFVREDVSVTLAAISGIIILVPYLQIKPLQLIWRHVVDLIYLYPDIFAWMIISQSAMCWTMKKFLTSTIVPRNNLIRFRWFKMSFLIHLSLVVQICLVT